MFDGAFYLAGYSVELALKARICERLGIPNLFDEKNLDVNAIKGNGDIRKALKTHNLLALLVFSGLKIKFENGRTELGDFAKINAKLFNAWDETARYKPCGYVNSRDVEKLILTWIEQN